jgi:putative hydrolase of the HAD superfamily
MLSFLLFDLDNTLYPKSCGLDREISRRMTAFAASWLNVSFEEAARLRKTKMVAYGTTLRWLVEEHGLDDQNKFLVAVHPENVGDYIRPTPELRVMLNSLGLPRAILTNAPEEHARRVLTALGAEDLFPRIFDIRSNGFTGKPDQAAYTRPLAEMGWDIRQVLFMDDMPHYLVPFRDMGGQGVLVDEDGLHADTGLPSIKKITELETYISFLKGKNHGQ